MSMIPSLRMEALYRDEEEVDTPREQYRFQSSTNSTPRMECHRGRAPVHGIYDDEEVDVATPRDQWGTTSGQGDVSGKGGYAVMKQSRQRTPSPECLYHSMLQRESPCEKKMHQKESQDQIITESRYHDEEQIETPREQYRFQSSANSTPRVAVHRGRSPVRGLHDDEEVDVATPRDQWGTAPCHSRQRTPSPEYFYQPSWQAVPQKQQIVELPQIVEMPQMPLQQQPPAVLVMASLVEPPPMPTHPRRNSKTVLDIASLVDPFHKAALAPGPVPGTGAMSQRAAIDAASKKSSLECITSLKGQLSGAQVSIGSVGHPHSCGEACKFALKPKGCKDGANCVRCHLCQWSRHGK